MIWDLVESAGGILGPAPLASALIGLVSGVVLVHLTAAGQENLIDGWLTGRYEEDN